MMKAKTEREKETSSVETGGMFVFVFIVRSRRVYFGIWYSFKKKGKRWLDVGGGLEKIGFVVQSVGETGK